MVEKGLGEKEAKELLLKYGPNEIRDVAKTTPLKIFLRQIKSNFVIYLLVIAALISFFVGKNITAFAILMVVFIVVIAGFVQEYKSEKAIETLRSMLVPVSIVIREGKEKEILSSEIVPGDILVLRNGERIPADAIVLEEKELRVNESAITGEFSEIKKFATSDLLNYEESNQIFMGTFVVNGKCIAKVTHTGMNTRFGQISKIISTTEKELPLQKKVNYIAKVMTIVAIVFALLTGSVILFQNENLTSEVLVTTLILMIAIASSAFPAGFPVVLITTLAFGSYRMAKRNAIVNRMSIIETLGETTIICSDKTGTLTKGEMTVKKIFINNNLIEVTGAGYDAEGKFLSEKKVEIIPDENFDLMMRCAVLCNDATITRTGEDKRYFVRGSPTETALLIMAAKANVFMEDLKFERVEEVPFSSERKIMSVLCKSNSEYFVFSKGAPEILIKNCKWIQRGNKIFRTTQKEKDRIIKETEKVALQSFRTVALAYKKTKSRKKEEIEDDLIFLGFVAMEDPPREGVKESIIQCRRAGISVKMITGDKKETALAIAEQIGLYGKVIEGAELEKLTDNELEKRIGEIVIFARVKPEHKIKIVKALKKNGEVVTMTGDGINDAPALKEAHIGIAMGKSGTDVSRSVSDLILKDDNFSTIVEAVKEGRTIFNNIRKFVTYQLSCNVAELLILLFGVLLAPILGWQIPILLALQILFMNLVTDNLPALTLGFNPYSKDVMEQKPRKETQIMNKKMLSLLFFTSFLLTLFVLVSYFVSFNVLGKSQDYSRTVALLSLICLEIASAYNYRSFRKGVLNRSPFTNRALFVASTISIIATILIIYTPINKIFETVPVGFEAWGIAIFFSFLLILIFDILKFANKNNKIINLEN